MKALIYPLVCDEILSHIKNFFMTNMVTGTLLCFNHFIIYSPLIIKAITSHENKLMIEKQMYLTNIELKIN